MFTVHRRRWYWIYLWNNDGSLLFLLEHCEQLPFLCHCMHLCQNNESWICSVSVQKALILWQGKLYPLPPRLLAMYQVQIPLQAHLSDWIAFDYDKSNHLPLQHGEARYYTVYVHFCSLAFWLQWNFPIQQASWTFPLYGNGK